MRFATPFLAHSCSLRKLDRITIGSILVPRARMSAARGFVIIAAVTLFPRRAAPQESPNPTQATQAPVQVSTGSSSNGFFGRLLNAYLDDWKGTASEAEAKYRGFPPPESNPPFPWDSWPYGGSPTIGVEDASEPPLMKALYGGPFGDAIKRSRVKVYGWVNVGYNASTSHGNYANAPAAYYQLPNSVQLDQVTLYIDRRPDTVQTQHFDWGFRLTNLYGLDYRFTTAKGIFSDQLLKNNQKYGYDPVMAYVDLYWGQVAAGLNVRIGRYISLPDIEAQLAPDNLTYSHSLTYTYDAYTQTGIVGTLRLNDHWLFQLGVSAGNDVAPWAQGTKPTLTACGSYTWARGGDNLYACANSVNDGNYGYNNLQAYYLTWYHKFNDSWFTATEAWYMYERNVPDVSNSAALEPNANGAFCNPGQTKCFAPEWAIVNYVEKKFSKSDYLTIRNEYFDDIKGQRTGTKTRYSEHLLGWGHWFGSTILLRPELRYERSYDNPAYAGGTKRDQLIFAPDVILKY